MNKEGEVSSLNISFDKRFGPEFFKRIPTSAGLFWFLDRKRQLLVIDVTSNLKRKISSFGHSLVDLSTKSQIELLHQVHEINWSICEDVNSAKVIVENLCQKKQPVYKLIVDSDQFCGLNLDFSQEEFTISVAPEEVCAPSSYGGFRVGKNFTLFINAFVRLNWFLSYGGSIQNWPAGFSKNLPLKKAICRRSIALDFNLWSIECRQFYLGQSAGLVDVIEKRIVPKRHVVDAFTYGVLINDLQLLRKFFRSILEAQKNIRANFTYTEHFLPSEWQKPLRIEKNL